jgi:hypothetical protein
MESSTDKSTDTTDTSNNDPLNDNNHDDVDCFSQQAIYPVLPQDALPSFIEFPAIHRQIYQPYDEYQ